MSLEGKVAVVTGAARGLGRAISLKLAEDGAAVAVWDLRAEGADETAALIRKAGGRAFAHYANCANASDIAAAAAATRAALGPVAILVNNAALSPFMRFGEITEEIWDELMVIDLKGPFLCTREMIPDMLAAGWGRIVNISSSAAQTGASCAVHYAAAKGGVLGFTKAMAMEFADKGITVNAVPPGFVASEGLLEAPVDVAKTAASSPMKRPGEPRNIAAAVAFLASDGASYITGHTLSVNGGRYCN
jgi:2-hydroxycyclohexanecarboxyl-CoA dehydrogenase